MKKTPPGIKIVILLLFVMVTYTTLHWVLSGTPYPSKAQITASATIARRDAKRWANEKWVVDNVEYLATRAENYNKVTIGTEYNPSEDHREGITIESNMALTYDPDPKFRKMIENLKVGDHPRFIFTDKPEPDFKPTVWYFVELTK